MQMPGRSYNAGTGYRYGFNGKENDNEVKGTGNQQDYGARIYDTRVGRFLSVDVLTSNYPWYSPYQFAGNTPIQAIDIDGLEEYVVVKTLFKSGAVKTTSIQYTVQKSSNIKQNVNSHFREVLKANPDGTVQLGDYLTDKKVFRIIIDANGKETSASDDNLTKQEQAIVDQKSINDEPTNPDNFYWSVVVNKKKYSSETARNTEIMQDKIASRTFKYIPPVFNGMALKPNMNLNGFDGSNNYTYGGLQMPDAGKLGDNLLSSLNTLAAQLKKAENIKSITINLNQGINVNQGTSEYNTAQQHGVMAVKNAVNYLQKQLKGSGITVNQGYTNTVSNAGNDDLKRSGRPTGVNIQIN